MMAALTRSARGAAIPGHTPTAEVEEMIVAEVMTPLVVSVNVDAPVAAAAQIMLTNNIGFLPVRDRGRLVGILTDRDITIRAAAHGRNLEGTPVEEVMTRSVVQVGQDRDLETAVRMMERSRVSRLVVVDDCRQIVGVLSIHDIPRLKSN